MICSVCRQSEIFGGLTAVTLGRGEFKLVVNSVPAWICPSCNEAYLDEDVAERLLRATDDMSKARMLDSVIEYHGLP